MWQNGDGCDCEAVVSRCNKAGELEKLPSRRNIVDWMVSASETIKCWSKALDAESGDYS